MSVDNRPATVAWAPTGIPTPEGWEEWQPRTAAPLEPWLSRADLGTPDYWTRDISTSYTFADVERVVEAWQDGNPQAGDMLTELPEGLYETALAKIGHGSIKIGEQPETVFMAIMRSVQQTQAEKPGDDFPAPPHLIGTQRVGSWVPRVDIWRDPWTREEWTGPVVDGCKPIEGGIIRASHGTPLPDGIEPYEPPAGQNRSWLVDAPIRYRSFMDAYLEWRHANSPENLVTVLRPVPETGRVAVGKGRAVTLGEYASVKNAKADVDRGRYNLSYFSWLPDADRLIRVVEVSTPDGRETFADEDFGVAFNVALRIAQEEKQ